MSIFAAIAVLLEFSSDFGSISSQKSMFFLTRFPHAARVFFEMATLTIVWFLYTQSHFFMFRVVAFFREKIQKNSPQLRSERSLKKRPSGYLFWDPKFMKIDVGTAGTRENRRKNRKNGMPKFTCFFAYEKTRKKQQNRFSEAPRRG